MSVTPTMTTALVCAALLGAAIFVLGFNVTRMRGVTALAGGNQAPTDPAAPLLIAIRAHGNASEYVPTLLVLFLLAAWLQPAWWTIALILAATASRLLHATMMLASSSLAQESRLRMSGAMGTYAFGFALAVVVAVGAVTAA